MIMFTHRVQLFIVFAAAGLGLLFGGMASAAVLGEFNYDTFAHGTSNPSAPNVAGVDGVFVSSISRTPGGEGDSNGLGTIAVTQTRDSTAVDFDSTALVIGLGTTGRNPFANEPILASQDFLTFTLINQTPELRLGSFSFDFGASVRIGDSTGVMSAARLFYSLNAQPFVAVGEQPERIVPSGGSGFFTGFIPSTIDLAAMPLLSENDSIEFRLAFGDNSGAETVNKGAYIDNLVLSGTAIPEPAGIGLIGIAGLALLRRGRMVE